MSDNTIRIIAELFIILVVTLYAAYIGALIDIKLIQRRARKQAEQQRIVELLKRRV